MHNGCFTVRDIYFVPQLYMFYKTDREQRKRTGNNEIGRNSSTAKDPYGISIGTGSFSAKKYDFSSRNRSLIREIGSSKKKHYVQQSCASVCTSVHAERRSTRVQTMDDASRLKSSQSSFNRLTTMIMTSFYKQHDGTVVGTDTGRSSKSIGR